MTASWRRRALARGPAAALAAAPPPRLAVCAAASPVPCYGQDPVHEAHRPGGLYAPGITGAGTTIAVVISEAGPWVARDLTVYDRYLRLPPTRLEALSYDGARPGSPRHPATGYWEQEGAMDLDRAHFMTPGAGSRSSSSPSRTGRRTGQQSSQRWTRWRGWPPASALTSARAPGVCTRPTSPPPAGTGSSPRIRAGLQAASPAGVSVIAGGPAGPARRRLVPLRTIRPCWLGNERA